MIGKVGFDGCTFSTGFALQRIIHRRIIACDPQYKEELYPVTIDIPATPAYKKTCQAWVQIRNPDRVAEFAQIMTAGIRLLNTTMYAEVAANPAEHYKSLSKVYAWQINVIKYHQPKDRCALYLEMTAKNAPRQSRADQAPRPIINKATSPVISALK